MAGGTACEFGIPRAHRCLVLIYRRAVIYTYDLRIFSLSLSFFKNETINEKSILFHFIRIIKIVDKVVIAYRSSRR